MKLLTKMEILQDFKDNFVENPGNRAHDGVNCQYLTFAGKKCAIGRWFTEDALERLGDFDYPVEDVYGAYSGEAYSGEGLGCDDFLMPEVRGHDVTFWSELQELHDSPQYWHDYKLGLNPSGQQHYDDMAAAS